ncbi:FK506-binding protein 2-like [Anneissia japonica]|uniref:FK506-binding protein 2-like n=1 Tax=Anneissia japonica TaxID=1529436 RepID=UPI001425813A|nr:FK506-binding protein 2-like [Anneissia japonica]
MKTIYRHIVCLFILFCYIGSPVRSEKSVKIPEDLKIEVTFKPDECSKTTSHGDKVLVHYTGKLEDGSMFDTSRVNEDSEPIEFPLGSQEVIKGWDYGLVGMCMGEKRRLTIPPRLAYGDQGSGDKVPPGATLIFDVEMIEFKPNWRHGMPNTFRKIDQNDDKILSFEEISDFIKSEGTFTDPDLLKKMTKEVLDRDDRDKNGEISWSEFSGPKHDEL